MNQTLWNQVQQLKGGQLQLADLRDDVPVNIWTQLEKMFGEQASVRKVTNQIESMSPLWPR